ncbi:MAG: DNA/RNA non-specific endonuclease [Acidobacteria bacterium]|nr:DNA/RNA non-specific endonuclease [Acidobacteriota bacterium]
MPEAALLESASAEPSLAAALLSPPVPDPTPEPGPVEETTPESSPSATASDFADRLASPAGAERRGAPAVVLQLQTEYGNAYALEVVDRLRQSKPRNEQQNEATEEVAPGLPPPPPPPATPEPPPAEPLAEAAPAQPTAEAAPAPSAPASASPGGAPETAAPAPEPAAPAPASTTPAELSGEEPQGGEIAIDAAASPPEAETAPSEPPAAPQSEDAAAVPAPAASEGEAPAETERAPSSPQEDRAYQAVLARARAVARSQGHNNPAQDKAAQAQAAAPGPANELQDGAAGQQVTKMAGQQPAPFDKEAFKAALMEKIAQIAPKTLEEADEFKDDNKAGELKGAVSGKVQESKEGTARPVKDTAAETPDTGTVQPKPVEPLPPTDPGAPPADIHAQAAAPKPKTEAEVSLQQNSQELDSAAAGSSPPFTAEIAAKSNEPDFQSAQDARQQAQQDAAERPAQYREQEQAILGGARQQAAAQAANQTQAMHDSRETQFSAIVDRQGATQTEDQTGRAKVLADIRAIYNETKSAVEHHLGEIDRTVNDTFDGGAERARQDFENYVDRRMRDYKDERYSGVTGAGLWLTDKLLGLPDEVNVFYTEGRDLYIQQMDGVIDEVAQIVADGLNEAIRLIQEGQQRIQTYINEDLSAELRDVGMQAAEGIQGEFDTLAQNVMDHQNQLVDSLAQRYNENLQAVDARIEEMQAANRGLVDAALDAINSVIETIIQMKNMLLGVLARAADVIDKILSDPIGFLGNLIAAVRLGLGNFIAKIGTYLQQGLMGWLFGALAEAGITMPETFDLRGILSLVLQVLGLTYANIRARAVRILGEPMVRTLETAAEIFRVLITEGPAGIWRWVSDQLSNLGDVIIEGIKSFVIERIIIAGVTWLIGLLNPASAFIKACKAIYDVVMFFVTRGSQIMAFVNAVLDSLAAIAAGQISGAAAAVESALARAVPVVISFLASLLGLGGISDKIREIIQRIQAPVNRAIDWVINKAVDLVRAAGRLFGIGGQQEQEEEDPEKAAKVAAGKAAMHQEEAQYLEQGEITQEHAQSVAAKVKTNHPVFKSITVVSGEGTWDYRFEASPPQTETGKPKADGFSQEELEKVKPKSINNSSGAGGRAGPATGTVDLKDGDREAMPAIPLHGYQQGDHRGHLIGDRFGGSPSQANLVPMHPSLNLSTFKSYENEVADKITKTKSERGAALAFMDVTPNYPGNDVNDPSHYRPTSVTAGGKVWTFKQNSNPPELDEVALSRGGSFSNPSSGFFLTKVALNESTATEISEQTGLSATLAAAVVANRSYSRYSQLSAAGLDAAQIDALRNNRRVTLNKSD